jgi:autotransporter-associated beta strand protein
VSNTITGTGDLTLNNSGTTGTMNISAALNESGTITSIGTGTGTTTISGAVGVGVTNITQNSASSMLVLSGTNTNFAGSVTVTNGTLQLNGASALNAANTVFVAASGTFNVNANGIIGGLSGSGSVINTGTVKTLTLGGSGAYSFGGVISASTPANLSLIVGLTGSGTQTLTGANTYTGATTVNSGSLIVDGSIMGSTTTVGSSATLGGSGTIANDVVVNGILAPGSSVGTLGIGGALSLNATSTFKLELGGNQPGDGASFYDQVNAGGTISLNSSAQITLSLTNFTPNSGDVFYVLTQGGVTPFGSTFAGASEGSLIDFGDGVFAQITYLANWTGTQGTSTISGGNDVALFNVIPEPGALNSLLGGLGMLVGLQRFRRRRQS